MSIFALNMRLHGNKSRLIHKDRSIFNDGGHQLAGYWSSDGIQHGSGQNIWTYCNIFSLQHRNFIDMNTEKKIPTFHRRIFWDVDFDKLDYDLRASFIIERVFERGDVEDIRQCRRYYGDDRIRDVLLNSKFLPLGRIHLASAIIDRPIEAFRCYKLRQLNPGLYPY